MRQEQRTSPLMLAAASHAAPVGSTRAQQHAKPTCPLCQVGRHHSASNAVLDSFCEFHSTNPIPQRMHHLHPVDEQLLELPLHPAHEFAKSSDSISASPSVVEHVEFPYFDTQSSDPSERTIVSSPEYEKREHDTLPTIETSSAVLRRSPSPHSSISSAPTSPRSDRDSSPSLSSSPIEHFSSWTHRDVRTIATSSPSTARTPSPYTDITRLRIDTSGRGSLYPGSIFSGSQRSGANSYDVTVTIVSTDFASSVLCGYLRIQNLTKDYPELTTYFHAEIIGSRYGFITADEWGATESGDLAHWSHFPAFRSIQNQLKRPGLTMRERNRGTVFMRWKERFLVPDHKTKEISGASFAGFYYVAVTEAIEDTPANITAYYFHPQSEPLQQLSLRHVPQEPSGSFEFC